MWLLSWRPAALATGASVELGDEQFYNEPRRKRGPRGMRGRGGQTDNYATQSGRSLERAARRQVKAPLSAGKLAHLLAARPKTRADCAGIPRPCPFVGCRYNLALEITHTGSLRFTMVDHTGELKDGVNNCALDHANRGPMTLDEVAAFFGLTRERIRQQECEALGRLKNLESLDEACPDFDVRERLDADAMEHIDEDIAQ